MKIKKSIIITLVSLGIIVVLLTLLNKQISSNDDYKNKIVELKNKLEKFKKDNYNLKIEIENIQKTDQHYFKESVEIFDNGTEIKSITILEQASKSFISLISKYPNSDLIKNSKEYLKKITTKIDYLKKENWSRKEIVKLADWQSSKKAFRLLSKSKIYFTKEEYENLENYIKEKKDKPIEIDVRELLSNSSKYNSKIVKVHSLKAISNDVSKKIFSTYLSNGSGRLSFDTAIRIEIWYSKTKDPSKWVYLSTQYNPVITVVGKYFANDWFSAHRIKATKIFVE